MLQTCRIKNNAVRLDPVRRCVSLSGQEVQLTNQEYLLFEELFRHSALKGSPALSRKELLLTAWGSCQEYETRTIDVHVRRLRMKLGSDIIQTVYRRGYRINPAVLH